ncbi:putative cysteine dioxygenase [Streptomyces sp. NBRC 110611]|uniref:cysteine dioxygenase n=1 Tax=Streptomyces sp. NBRC 110611 TaxID=1621259 RepID=UPI00082B8E47|nr:cysteine dioxygenase family protein [Streptomyces sp. NBRC 110611]GAU68522.1 putative cysteine dioxygenase [Streptomyces sp. NBRC 110611]
MNSDVQIAGDPLALPHLLPPVPAHPHTVAGFAGLARSIAADRAAWAPLVRYDATTRWYHRLRTVPARPGEAPPGYEVWLLSWVPGQGSGRHDHGASAGVLTVLEGELTEHGGTTTGPRTLTAGAQRVFAPGYVHEIVNDSLRPAVSLHIYSPGLTDMPMHPRSPLRSAGETPIGRDTTAGTAATAPEILAP